MNHQNPWRTLLGMLSWLAAVILALAGLSVGLALWLGPTAIEDAVPGLVERTDALDSASLRVHRIGLNSAQVSDVSIERKGVNARAATVTASYSPAKLADNRITAFAVDSAEVNVNLDDIPAKIDDPERGESVPLSFSLPLKKISLTRSMIGVSRGDGRIAVDSVNMFAERIEADDWFAEANLLLDTANIDLRANVDTATGNGLIEGIATVPDFIQSAESVGSFFGQNNLGRILPKITRVDAKVTSEMAFWKFGKTLAQANATNLHWAASADGTIIRAPLITAAAMIDGSRIASLTVGIKNLGMTTGVLAISDTDAVATLANPDTLEIAIDHITLATNDVAKVSAEASGMVAISKKQATSETGSESSIMPFFQNIDTLPSEGHLEATIDMERTDINRLTVLPFSLALNGNATDLSATITSLQLASLPGLSIEKLKMSANAVLTDFAEFTLTGSLEIDSAAMLQLSENLSVDISASGVRADGAIQGSADFKQQGPIVFEDDFLMRAESDSSLNLDVSSETATLNLDVKLNNVRYAADSEAEANFGASEVRLRAGSPALPFAELAESREGTFFEMIDSPKLSALSLAVEAGRATINEDYAVDDLGFASTITADGARKRRVAFNINSGNVRTPFGTIRITNILGHFTESEALATGSLALEAVSLPVTFYQEVDSPFDPGAIAARGSVQINERMVSADDPAPISPIPALGDLAGTWSGGIGAVFTTGYTDDSFTAAGTVTLNGFAAAFPGLGASATGILGEVNVASVSPVYVQSSGPLKIGSITFREFELVDISGPILIDGSTVRSDFTEARAGDGSIYLSGTTLSLEDNRPFATNAELEQFPVSALATFLPKEYSLSAGTVSTNLNIGGTLGAAGANAFSLAGSRGTVSLEGIAFSSSEPEFSVTGLSAALSLKALLPPHSEPRQQVTFKAITYGKFTTREGSLQLTLSPNGISMSDGLINFAGGKIDIEEFRYAFKAGDGLKEGDFSVVAKLQHVRLADLQELVPDFKGSISGKVSGIVRLKKEGDQIIPGDSNLELTEPGTLSYVDAGWLAGRFPEGDPRRKNSLIVEEALRRLAMSAFLLDLKNVEGDNQAITLRVAGDAPVEAFNMAKAPIDLRININGAVTYAVNSGFISGGNLSVSMGDKAKGNEQRSE